MRLILFYALTLFFVSCNNRATNEQENTTDNTAPVNNSTTPVAGPDTSFTAFGNEPFWALYVIHDRKLVFHPMDGNDVEVPFVLPSEIDAVTRRYSSSGDSATIELTIIKKDCSDGMSDETHQYETEVKVNAVTYRGCGRE